MGRLEEGDGSHDASASQARVEPVVARLRQRVQRLGIFGSALLVALLLILVAIPALVVGADPPVPQPVAFNHLHHTQTLQLQCEFCHTRVREGAHAGLPDAATCSMCHSTVIGESAEAARVTELLGAGDPLQFNKLFTLPSHVFYTHRRHAELGGLECANCHGDIADSETPPRRALVRIRMQFCIDCHEENEVTTDCAACHR